MNSLNIPKGVAFGAAIGALLPKFPHLQRSVELAQEIELQKATYMALGAERADVERMATFVVNLAKTTVVQNSKTILAAYAYNRRRILEGQPFIPADVREWAEGFLKDSMAELLDKAYRDMGVDMQAVWLLEPERVRAIVGGFLADAERLWQESIVT